MTGRHWRRIWAGLSGALCLALVAPTGAPARARPLNVGVVQTTTDLSQRLTRLRDLQLTPAPAPAGMPVIGVDSGTTYQTLLGVGAAMTDSSAWLIYDKLAPAARNTLMHALFGRRGIHLGFTLVPMGGTDFTAQSTPYSYDGLLSVGSDPLLDQFSVAHDDAYIVPLLREMLALNPRESVFAVPWSAPPWMKHNHAYNNLRRGGTLIPKYFDSFARYFVKFIQAYAERGIPVAAIAPVNEPTAPARYPSMEFSEPGEVSWIRDSLAPQLNAAGLSTRIYGADVPWKRPGYGQLMATSAARPALTGIAWHCYGGDPSPMRAVHAQAPGLDQIVTECSPGLTRYTAADLAIASMRNWASVVSLWNLALDPAGGPVQPPNSGCGGCTGLVTVDETSHSVTYLLSYYQLGQVSAFLEPGARRVDSPNFVTYGAHGPSSGLDDLAFENPDGRQVVVAYNNSAAPVQFAVTWKGRALTYTLPAGATVTLFWNGNGR